MLRDMVHRRHLCERTTTTPGSLLGNCLGQISRGNDQPNDNGFSFCKDNLCLYDKKTSGSELQILISGLDRPKPLLRCCNLFKPNLQSWIVCSDISNRLPLWILLAESFNWTRAFQIAMLSRCPPLFHSLPLLLPSDYQSSGSPPRTSWVG